MHRIAAGIVLYNPDLNRLRENIDSIYKQVQLLVLIDNNSSNIESIENEYRYNKNIIIMRNNSNIGIAKALNQLINFCESKGYEWVLTLDQDSVCPSNIIEEYKKYLGISNIAIISPVVVDRNRIQISVANTYTSKYELIEKCITSAALTNVTIWKNVGGFDEIMFIDLVDFEYCKRVVLNGYKIIKINSVVLLHEIGHITLRKFLFWKVEVKNHSEIRKYYMARNILYCSKKYRKFGSVLIAYLRVFKLILTTLLYEQNKCIKIRKIIQGVYDVKNIKKVV